MKFHERLYTLRKTAGMTQNDLAERLNVSRQAVSRWEMGTTMPDLENLISISDLFGVTLDELLKDQTEPTEPVPQKAEAHYWDYVPSKWWLPLVLAGAVLVCEYLWIFLYAAFPAAPEATSGTASDSRFLWLLSCIFSPVGFSVMVRLFPWISIACLIWGLVKWQKAKK